MSEPAGRTAPTDAQLVERLRAGDRGAFRQVYERQAPEVLRLLGRLVRPDEVADAAQEAFVRLHRGLRQGYDPSLPLRPYVLRIARNVAVECLRKREKQRPVHSLDEATPVADRSPERAALEGERDALIQRALAGLSPEHRAAVVLRYAHGLTQLEIAQALDCSERTVRNRLRAAATLLERELRRLGLDDHEVTA